MQYPINWQLLNDALCFFQKHGYEYIEVPWIVHESIIRFTLPEGNNPLRVEGKGSLIGSAEQGFLSLVVENKLKPGKYVSCSPCFRNEPTVDKYHQTYFMKVELYNDKDISKDAIWDMIKTVQKFLFEYVQNIEHCKEWRIIKHLNEIDIELNGIEIGSYGIRTINGHSWVYGTGLALPRLTIVNGRNLEGK